MKRIVRYGAGDGKLFLMAYSALCGFRPGPGRSERRRRTETLLWKLAAGSVEREPMPGQDPDLVLRALSGPATFALDEGERDLLIEALDGVDWPVYASDTYRQSRELLWNAERAEDEVT